MSFYTSLSGLKGAQTDLSVISNNIANVSTTGFKKSSTQFGDLISSSSFQDQGSVTGQGTQLKSITQDFSQGSYESTGSALDVMISGEGFLVTRGGLTAGQVAYTRNGALSVDANRYLTDVNGNYVQALPVDSLGNTTSSSLSTMTAVQIPASTGTAKATGNIAAAVTLPTTDDIVATTPFDPANSATYSHANSTTMYDTAGNALSATVYYVKTGQNMSTGEYTYDAHVVVGDEEASISYPSTGTGPVPLTFNASGELTSPASPTYMASAAPTGASSGSSFYIDFTGTTTQPSSFAVTSMTQDGNTTAKLSNLAIGTDGLITATYSNGTTTPLGKLAMATFANPSGLKQLGDASWAATGLSGTPTVGEPGSDGFGDISSGALETSNVDITEELVALISAQRNFQANAKAIETNNTMTSVIVNMQG